MLLRFLLVLLFLLVGSPAVAGQRTFTHGVASGDVTPTSAILWTRVDRKALVHVELSTDLSFHPGRRGVIRAHVQAEGEDDFTAKIRIDQLEPATRYFYRFHAGGASSPTGTFKTAPLPGISAGLRLTWSSDSDGSIPGLEDFHLLNLVIAEDSDFFVWLGDTVYMDTFPPIATDLVAMRAKYRQVRSLPAVQNLLASTSVYSIWDDHELEDNWTGETVDPELFAAGRRAFEEYMPVREWQPGTGFYRTFRWGKDAELFILDERSFRSASAEEVCLNDPAPLLPALTRVTLGLLPEPPEGCVPFLLNPARSMLGSTQKAEFLGALLTSNATWKIIINEVPIAQFFALPYDRWEGYPVERLEILEFIRFHGINNVVFVTGDMHANAIAEVIGNPFLPPVAQEFIAGPVAQITFAEGLESVVGQPLAGLLLDLLATVGPFTCLAPDALGYGVLEIDSQTKDLSVALKTAGGTVCAGSIAVQ